MFVGLMSLSLGLSVPWFLVSIAGLPVNGLDLALRSISGFDSVRDLAVVPLTLDMEVSGRLGFINVANGASSSSEEWPLESDSDVSLPGDRGF